MDYETRYLTASKLEVRTLPDGSRQFDGYALRFNEWSEDLGGFRERCEPGCITRTLADGADVRHLINHDPNLILGRTASGTTELIVDAEGVRAITTMPDTSYARDLAVSVERGDVSQMSFGFRKAPGGDSWNMDASPLLERTLTDIDLRDVSTVTFPAYPTTTQEVRSMLGKAKREARAVGAAVVAWDDEDGMADYLDDVSASLSDSAAGWGYCSDCTMDGTSALVVWYADGASCVYVVPVELDDQGEPFASDMSTWVAVEGAWVIAAEEDARALSPAERRSGMVEHRDGKAISADNAAHVAGAMDAAEDLKGHLAELAAAAGISVSDAEAAISTSDEGIEGNAAPDGELRADAIRLMLVNEIKS